MSEVDKLKFKDALLKVLVDPELFDLNMKMCMGAAQAGKKIGPSEVMHAAGYSWDTAAGKWVKLPIKAPATPHGDDPEIPAKPGGLADVIPEKRPDIKAPYTPFELGRTDRPPSEPTAGSPDDRIAKALMCIDFDKSLHALYVDMASKGTVAASPSTLDVLRIMEKGGWAWDYVMQVWKDTNARVNPWPAEQKARVEKAEDQQMLRGLGLRAFPAGGGYEFPFANMVKAVSPATKQKAEWNDFKAKLDASFAKARALDEERANRIESTVSAELNDLKIMLALGVGVRLNALQAKVLSDALKLADATSPFRPNIQQQAETISNQRARIAELEKVNDALDKTNKFQETRIAVLVRQRDEAWTQIDSLKRQSRKLSQEAATMLNQAASWLIQYVKDNTPDDRKL